MAAVKAIVTSRAEQIATRARSRVRMVKDQREASATDDTTLDYTALIFPELSHRDNVACAIDLAVRLQHGILPSHYYNLLMQAYTIKRAAEQDGLNEFIATAAQQMIDTLESLPGDWWKCWRESDEH